MIRAARWLGASASIALLASACAAESGAPGGTTGAGESDSEEAGSRADGGDDAGVDGSSVRDVSDGDLSVDGRDDARDASDPDQTSGDALADNGESDPRDEAALDDGGGDATPPDDEGADAPEGSPDLGSDGPREDGAPDAITDAGVDSGDSPSPDTADAADGDDDCTGGSLCGPAFACCPAGNECIDGVCLPPCVTGIRCGADGAVCCGTDQVCLADSCEETGGDCLDAYDCEAGEFCEPTISACLPQPAVPECQVVPAFDALDAAVEWSWEDAPIISIPVVADLDADGAPEVVVNLTQVGASEWPLGEVAILDGVTGELERRISDNPGAGVYASHGRSTIAVGDVSGDGLPDIVYAGRASGSGARCRIHAVDRNGAPLWTSHLPSGSAETTQVENAAITLANFDGDPMAEVVIGAMLIDHDGTVLWNQGGNGGAFGTNSGYTGGISAVADLDGDGAPEIVSGRNAWRVAWNPGPPATATVTSYWAYGASGDDGYPAIADLDLDGTPEVVLVTTRSVRVIDGQTGLAWCGVDPTGVACDADGSLRTDPLSLPGGTSSNRGGPPTVADFDGDGRPEIGVAGGYAYAVFDIARPGEELPVGGPVPAPGALFIRWSSPTRDLSSNVTGSAVFDFQGDGSAEVVYADECYMRVYSGRDGVVQLEVQNSSATIHEYPIVVDVDADGNSEILIVANDSGASSNCSIAGYRSRRGLFVYGDRNDEWVPTRRVWTQHTYHVTNAGSDGNVPLDEVDNWTLAGLNNYRQNVQGEGVFNGPDLGVDLSWGYDRCVMGEVTLRVRVSNRGSLGVAAGVPVAIRDGAGGLVAVLETSVSLLPGASAVLSHGVESPAPGATADFTATVDDDGTGSGEFSECREDNNGARVTIRGCYSP